MIPYLNLKKLNTPYHDAFLEKTSVFLEKGHYILEAPVEHRVEVEKEFVDCMIRAPKNLCKVAMICDAELETRWKYTNGI